MPTWFGVLSTALSPRKNKVALEICIFTEKPTGKEKGHLIWKGSRNDNAFFFYTIPNYENSVSTEWAWIRAQGNATSKTPALHCHCAQGFL